MDAKQELADIVMSGRTDYKGWKCSFVGVGSIVMEKDGKKVTGHSSLWHGWLEPAWEDCKSKIDAL